MRVLTALLVFTVTIVFGVPSLDAQTVWQTLVNPAETRIWADSASWTRNGDSTLAVRVRIVEGRVDGKHSDDATVLRVEINCAQRLIRLRQKSLERAGRIVDSLPDSRGTSDWVAPHDGWTEDYILRAACERMARWRRAGSDT